MAETMAEIRALVALGMLSRWDAERIMARLEDAR